MYSQNQSETRKYNQNVPQQASHTVFFNDHPRDTLGRSENYPIFQQNKNMTNKHHIRNQPHYSEDEEYYHQNQQRFKANQQKINGLLINPILFINQIFLNQIHETNKYDKQDITQRHTIIAFNQKTL